MRARSASIAGAPENLRLSEETVTLEDLSGQYDVSRERIRQIEVRAFEKLQKRMRILAQEKGMMASA